MIEFIILLLITVYCWSMGRIFLRKLYFSSGEEFVFSTGIGLALLGYIVLILGELRHLYFWPLVVILCASSFLNYKNIKGVVKDIVVYCRKIKLKELSYFEKIILLIVLIVFVVSLSSAIAPPIGNDALAYHLLHPKIFIEQHAVKHIQYTRESLWPYLTEMLFTVGILLKSDILAKLFHYLFGLLSAIAIFCFAARFFNRRTGVLASVLFFITPAVFTQAGYAYVDLALCFYILCALYLFVLWSSKNNLLYLVFSGVFLGLALSIKVLAGIALIIIGIGVIAIIITKKPNLKLLTLYILSFCTPVLLCGFIWYLRSFIILGNPVFPFMSEIFKSGWSTEIGKELGLNRGLLGFLRLPWDLTMYPDSFGGEQIGFLFLGFLPFALFVNWKRRLNLFLVFFILAYTAIWFKLDPNIRFLFPIFPVACLLLSDGINKALYKKHFTMIKSFIVFGLLINLSLAVYYNLNSLKLLTNSIDKQSYLLKKERTYAIANWINENIAKKDALLISANEPRLYYFDMPAIIYHTFKLFNPDHKDREKALNLLRNKYANIYLLKTDNYGKLIPSDITLSKLIFNKKPIYSASFIEDDRHIKYYLYQIK